MNSYSKIQTACQIVVAIAVLVTCAHWFRGVLMPFALAAFLALNLSSLIDVQTKRLKFPRWLAVGMTFALGILLVFLLSLVISASLSDLGNKSGQYVQGFDNMWDSVSEKVQDIPGWDKVQERLGVDHDQLSQRVANSFTSALGTAITGLTGNVLSLLSQSLVVILFLGFMIGGGETKAEPASGVWAVVASQIKHYVVAQTFVSAVTGILIALTLGIIGVDLAMVFGLLAFVLNFIPNIGSMISTLLPLPVVIFSPSLTFTEKLLAIIIPGVIQFVTGNILNPKVMANSLDLHPVVILLMLMLWGALWGGVGMFLATPITAMMKIFFEKMDSTKPLALLLAGKPAALLSLGRVKSPEVLVPTSLA
jgi:AI-2 transport protein TqsA